MAVVELHAVDVFAGTLPVCRNLSLQLGKGQMLGVLGRNGVGKTTLLHCIMGFRPLNSGSVRISGEESGTYSRRQFARQVGLLFQEADSSMPATVQETVMLGRHPYAENLLWDTARDFRLARETLALLDLEALADRQVATLSGGEKQRLATAMLLAQDPRLYLLDEPSNHLDIDYQIRILSLLAQRIQQRQAASLMASHDINLVSRFCDDVLLLLGNGHYIYGPTPEVLTAANLELAFNCRISIIATAGRRYFLPA